MRNEKKPQMKPENFEEKSEKIFGKKKKKKRSRKMGEKYPKITIQGKMQKKNPRKKIQENIQIFFFGF